MVLAIQSLPLILIQVCLLDQQATLLPRFLFQEASAAMQQRLLINKIQVISLPQVLVVTQHLQSPTTAILKQQEQSLGYKVLRQPAPSNSPVLEQVLFIRIILVFLRLLQSILHQVTSPVFFLLPTAVHHLIKAMDLSLKELPLKICCLDLTQQRVLHLHLPMSLPVRRLHHFQRELLAEHT